MQLTCRQKTETGYRCLVSEAFIQQQTGEQKEVDVVPSCCESCMRANESVPGQTPRSLNFMTASLIIRAGVPKDIFDRLLPYLKSYKITLATIGEGVGTELHEILKRRGYEIEEGCECLAWIARMNWGGPSYVRESLDPISAAMYREFVKREPRKAKIVPEKVALWRARKWIHEALANWNEKLKEQEREKNKINCA